MDRDICMHAYTCIEKHVGRYNQDVGKNLKGLICLNVYPKVSGDVKETLNSNDACFGPEFILVFL